MTLPMGVCRFCNIDLFTTNYNFSFYVPFPRFNRFIPGFNFCHSCFCRECKFMKNILNESRPRYSCGSCLRDIQSTIEISTRFYRNEMSGLPILLSYICPKCSDDELGLR